MKKTQAISELLDALSGRPIIFTTGYTCRIAKSIRDDPGHFYMVGSMGLSACIAAGVAIATGAVTIVVDGDGSLLMNPGALIVVGSESALPVVHILLDDGCYASTGGQHTASDRVDFERLALASGYRRTSVVDDAGALRREVDGALRDLSGPILIHCKVQADEGCTAPRIDLPLPEIAARFSTYISAGT